ncbi:MAG TPA: hypothetical protein VEK36_00550 [Candidatus Paceibacterota bacterium]|nr:hypothetical protein [Candidatus Paceibacterota bacterium]
MSEIKLLFNKNYLAMIRNAARGKNHMFQNLYASVDGAEDDILKNGGLACTFFVAGILFINKLISDMHAGDGGGLRKDMLANGWQEIADLREGAILEWEQQPGADGLMHSHWGFYMANEQAVSNDSNGIGIPIIHHYTNHWQPARKIVKIYWHPLLDEI